MRHVFISKAARSASRATRAAISSTVVAGVGVLLLATTGTAALAADVGVSLSIGQPGFYGQVDIGNYPQPRVIYRNPVLVRGGSYNSTPVYLNVPRNHSRNWRRYCGRYNACGERVYFVQNDWYNREYVPRYQAQHQGQHQGQQQDRHDDNRSKNHNERNNEHRGNGH
jgi:hypothetical protein